MPITKSLFIKYMMGSVHQVHAYVIGHRHCDKKVQKKSGRCSFWPTPSRSCDDSNQVSALLSGFRELDKSHGFTAQGTRGSSSTSTRIALQEKRRRSLNAYAWDSRTSLPSSKINTCSRTLSRNVSGRWGACALSVWSRAELLSRDSAVDSQGEAEWRHIGNCTAADDLGEGGGQEERCREWLGRDKVMHTWQTFDHHKISKLLKYK